MTTKLHPIRHDLPTILWCGPAALSVTTGYPTSVIHRAIRRHTGRRFVKGVSNAHLALAAKELGFRLVPVFDYFYAGIGKPTLAAFLRMYSDQVAKAPIIVNVTGHYVVVHGRTFIDNQVKVPVSSSKAPGRRRRVKRAWAVMPLLEKLPLTNTAA